MMATIEAARRGGFVKASSVNCVIVDTTVMPKAIAHPIMAERKPITTIVEKGYQGVEVEGVRILHSEQRRGITWTLKAMIHQRSAIEPIIGHMTMGRHLGRNPLKNALGDTLHALIGGAGHNLRIILAKLRLLCARWNIARTELLAAWVASTRLSLRVST